MKNGFIKVGAVSPMLSIADIDTNCQRCVEAAIDASNKGVKVLVFPELSLSGYTCADLFKQKRLDHHDLGVRLFLDRPQHSPQIGLKLLVGGFNTIREMMPDIIHADQN